MKVKPGLREAAALALWGCLALAQVDVAPVNDRPNPYRPVEGWAKLPAGRVWGAVSAVDIAPDGRSIWVVERCGGVGCAGSALPPILEFDESGTLVRSFGAGMFLQPHGLHVDRAGNVWVTDASDGTNASSGQGHQVFEFSPERGAAAHARQGRHARRWPRIGSTGPPTSRSPPMAMSSSPMDMAATRTRASSSSPATAAS